MDSRREFIKKAALLSGAVGIANVLPASIQKALAIDPVKGSTFLDAEHIVILMQENRSFDHCYGALRGVRGFDDPRAIRLPNNNPVWAQTNELGQTFGPFRLDINNTRATHMGSLPHSWPDQVDARNEGKYDQWLTAKARKNKDGSQPPLTMGYHTREDIPFYYSLADAFTVCDQNFCSALTGTTPNRLYLWTGTIRNPDKEGSPAHVMNGDTDYHKEVSWKTFPERLEENGIEWKIYQNEISLESGLEGEKDDWLANFTDNPIEWFSQYNVRFAKNHLIYLEKMEKVLPEQISEIESRVQSTTLSEEEKKKLMRELVSKKNLLARAKDRHKWSKENFDKLSAFEKSLHQRAFANNENDPDYREITKLKYTDDGVEREMTIPKGDPLYQFRKDVNDGKLPTVSWLVGSANFSDHPGSPWYGAWYVSEAMDILTKNPEVWKKTIFILCYDENDGYFDHVPPFVAPDPTKSDSGKVSKGIDASAEFVRLEDDLKMRGKQAARESSIGLGYRVPLVIASPWSRGGVVCSQVFDHTSILQLMEKVLSHKTGKQIKETNISSWRRAVCGDLSSAFRPYNGEKITMPDFLAQNQVYENIHKAQFKKDPSAYTLFSDAELEKFRKTGQSDLLSSQEKGTRPAANLPYELSVNGKTIEGNKFELSFTAAKNLFGDRSAGSAFMVYAYNGNDVKVRNYAVEAGETVTDSWKINDFAGSNYHLKVYGPNGFYRSFKGKKQDPALSIADTNLKNGNLQLQLENTGNQPMKVIVRDKYDKAVNKTIALDRGKKSTFSINTSNSLGWYDCVVTLEGNPEFKQEFGGKVERV